MNILHINSHDLLGARFNGYDMQKIIYDKHEVAMAVWEKNSTNTNVHLIPPSSNFFLKKMTGLLITLTARLGFDRLFGFAGALLPYKSFFKRADIIHLHLIHNYSNFSILSLPKLCRKKPLVWTLHDPWAFTGGCEHSFECEKWITGCHSPCPHPRARSILKRYTPNLHWKLKKYIYSKTDLTLIVASEWMKNKISLSPLLGHLPCSLIPFGVDINIFQIGDKSKARKELGINTDDKVIAFRDPGFKVDKFKGMKWLMEALKIYEPEKPTSLLIFQDGNAFDILSPKYNIVKTGWINDNQMAVALSAADIFLMPSIQESFGLMAVESMSCGVPVVVFEGSALPSIIKAPIGGLAVPSKDSLALANAIEFLLENEVERLKMGSQARAIVEAEYSIELYIQRHFELYNSIINQFALKSKKAKKLEL
jgi:glycosyltransferase involved in cell wall biosynthesis